jgi:hypothetical protein
MLPHMSAAGCFRKPFSAPVLCGAVLLVVLPSLRALGDGPEAPKEGPPGEAEAAPEGSLPPPTVTPPAPEPTPYLWPRVRVSADIRFSGLLGETTQVVEPLGWGWGLRFSASLLPVGAFSLGFLLDFQQDRFSRTLAQYPEVPQLLVHSTFAIMPQLDFRSRWVHPWLAVGGGASVARHESPLPDPQTQMPVTDNDTTVPLVRVAAGVGVSPLRWLEVGLSFDVSLTFSSDVGGVKSDATGMLVPGTSTLFAPGWYSLSLYASYNFY